MGKLVVLKLHGDLQQGFQITLEMGEDGQLPNGNPVFNTPQMIDFPNPSGKSKLNNVWIKPEND